MDNPRSHWTIPTSQEQWVLFYPCEAARRHAIFGAVLRRVLRYVAYPGMTGGFVIAGLWAVDHQWPAWLVGVTAVAVATVLVVVLELTIPYSPVWAVPRGDRFTDFCHLVFSNRAFDVGTILAIGVCAPLGSWLTARIGMPLWPHHWPLLVQALMAALLFELPWYWAHRIEHTSELLWRVHAVHHSSRRIYWWNFSRNHPFDNLFSAAVSIAPLALLGVGDAPLAIMAAFSAAHGILQHSNVDLRTGVLDYFLATARVHRWHHWPLREEADANFSPRTMLWDHVFGTFRFSPQRTPPEDVGLGPAGADFPEGYVEQMLIPFRSRYWRSTSSDRVA